MQQQDERKVAIRQVVEDRLDELTAQLDADTVRRAALAFIDGLDELTVRIVAGDNDQDRAAAAHTLAGSAETLGAVHLGAVCRRVMEAPGDPSLRGTLQADADLTQQVLDELFPPTDR